MTQHTPEIRFDDGAAYEEFMGRWSALAGNVFLDWQAPPPRAKWVDVGCGNGAFTELIVRRCAPDSVWGIDPSEEQIAYARNRFADRTVRFDRADAMALPCADGTFDIAVMALVIFFVPDPARGVAEMVRAVRPGGSVSTYAWDILGGGFPFAAMHEEMSAIGLTPLLPPSVEASRPEALRALWTEAGLVDVQSHVIRVERTFTDFEAFWKVALSGPRIAPRLATLEPQRIEELRRRVRARLPVAPDGSITYGALANAIKGTKPR